MLGPHLLLFALPAIVAVVLLLGARRLGELSGRQLVFLGAWYVLGFCLQYFGRSTFAWIGGLLLLSTLAVYLAIKLRAPEG